MNQQQSNAYDNQSIYSKASGKATRTLLKNINLVTNASMENSGLIEDDLGHEKAIGELSRQKLGFISEEMGGFQLSGSVMRYLHQVTQTTRLHATSQTLAGLITDMEEQIAIYHQIKRLKQSHDDKRLFENDIHEKVVLIEEQLRNVISHFSHHVYNDLITIDSLDIRIAENEKALVTIEQLNEAIKYLSVKRLNELAQQDSTLQRLLLKFLKSTVDKTLKELVQAGHKLRQSLTKLQKDKQQQLMNKLIDDWYQYLHKNPSFSPDISLATANCFNMAEPIFAHYHADLNDPDNDEILAEVAQKVGKQIKPLPSQSDEETHKKEESENLPVEDITQTEELIIEQSPFYKSIEEFYQMLQDTDNFPSLSIQSSKQFENFEQLENLNQQSEWAKTTELSGLSGVATWSMVSEDIVSHQDMEDTGVEDWLMGLVNYYYVNSNQFQPSLELHFKEHPVKNYSGNHIVTDVFVSRNQSLISTI